MTVETNLIEGGVSPGITFNVRYKHEGEEIKLKVTAIEVELDKFTRAYKALMKVSEGIVKIDMDEEALEKLTKGKLPSVFAKNVYIGKGKKKLEFGEAVISKA